MHGSWIKATVLDRRIHYQTEQSTDQDLRLQLGCGATLAVSDCRAKIAPDELGRQLWFRLVVSSADVRPPASEDGIEPSEGKWKIKHSITGTVDLVLRNRTRGLLLRVDGRAIAVKLADDAPRPTIGDRVTVHGRCLVVSGRRSPLLSPGEILKNVLSDDPGERRDAAEQIIASRSSIEIDIDTVIERLNSYPEPATVLALGTCVDESGVSPLLTTFDRDADPATRRACLEALAAIESPDATEPVMEFILRQNDSEYPEWWLFPPAIDTFVASGGSSALNELIDELTPTSVTPALIRPAERHVGPDHVDSLVDLLERCSMKHTARATIRAVAATASRSGRTVLISALNDERKFVRREAALVLANAALEDERVTTALIDQAARSSERSVRRACLDAVATRWVRDNFSDAGLNTPPTSTTIRALKAIGTDRAADVLYRLATSGPSSCSLRAEKALVEINERTQGRSPTSPDESLVDTDCSERTPSVQPDYDPVEQRSEEVVAQNVRCLAEDRPTLKELSKYANGLSRVEGRGRGRATALSELEWLARSSPKNVDLVEVAIDDESAMVRHCGVNAFAKRLQYSERDWLTERLIPVARTDPDPYVRKTAVLRLADDARTHRAYEAVADVARYDPSPLPRRVAAGRLKHANDWATEPHLAVTSDTDDSVLCWGYSAIGYAPSSRTVEALQAALATPGHVARKNAGKGIENCLRHCFERLSWSARDNSDMLFEQRVDAISRACREDVLNALDVSLFADRYDVRKAAALAMGQLFRVTDRRWYEDGDGPSRILSSDPDWLDVPSDRLTEPLIERLTDEPGESTRKAIATALGYTCYHGPCSRSEYALLEVSENDQSETVREAATEALQKTARWRDTK